MYYTGSDEYFYKVDNHQNKDANNNEISNKPLSNRNTNQKPQDNASTIDIFDELAQRA